MENVWFSLSNAPAAFRGLRWRAEISERGLRSLGFEQHSNGHGEGDERGLTAAQRKFLKRLKAKLLSRLRGGADDFDWDEFDLKGVGKFHLRVWQAMREIPAGKTESYGDVAARAGSPMAFRACGQACGSNRILIFIPCHRVVSSSGLGGFGYGLDWKRKLLAMEGADAETLLG